MALLANINRDAEKHPEPFTVDDFLQSTKRKRKQKPKPVSADAFFQNLVTLGLAKEMPDNAGQDHK